MYRRGHCRKAGGVAVGMARAVVVPKLLLAVVVARGLAQSFDSTTAPTGERLLKHAAQERQQA